MKKSTIIGAVSLSTALICTTSIFADGSSQPKVAVNGKAIATEAQIINDRTYVPLRAVSEALGAEVSWNENTKTAEINMKSNDEIVPDVLEKVSSSVVGIIGTLKPDEDSEYRYNKYQENFAHGTGVIIKESGEILTNAHVVKDLEKIVVVLSDGSGYEAKIKSIDEESDLALIKINKSGLPAATFGKQEDIIIGKTVIAIGTPLSFSLRNSASIGIISGVNRGIDSSYRLIQTDAAINPGNSGGPLVNLKGQVVGINSSKFMGFGIEGMGFSIPLNTIEYVLDQFQKNGKVVRPYIGALFEEGWAAKAGLPSKEGLTVSEIIKGSPAENGGLKIDDVVMSIQDHSVNSMVELNELLKSYHPDDTVGVKIKRGGAVMTVNLKFAQEKK